jgi:AcrR family transcriptional regulator
MPTQPHRAPRTAPELRRDQLIAAAVPQFAAHGYADAQMQAIADDVGVTRNLIHRYFPGGKHELYVDAVRLACSQLAGLFNANPDLPLAEKTPANIATYVDAILERNPLYVLYSRAEHSADDDVRAPALETRETVVAQMALNNLGTTDPPAPVAAALHGFISFMETVSETWREQASGDRASLEELLRTVFESVVQAATRRP